MDAVLSTLIETQRENWPQLGDVPLRLIDQGTSMFKALIALNIRMTQRYGEYRLYILSDIMERNLTSTKDLTVCEVYALLKFTEAMKDDRPKQI